MLGDDPTEFDGAGGSSAALGAHGPWIVFAVLAGIAAGALLTWLIISSTRRSRAEQIWFEINKAMRRALQFSPSDAVAGMLYVSRVIELQLGDLIWKGELGKHLTEFRKVVDEGAKATAEAPKWAYKTEVAVTHGRTVPMPPPEKPDPPNTTARKTLDEFEKYWSQREARISEIRQLQARLLGV